MSKLFDMKTQIDQIIQAKKLNDEAATTLRGKIGLKAGFLLAFVKPTTPDEPAKIEKLRVAVKEVLNAAM